MREQVLNRLRDYRSDVSEFSEAQILRGACVCPEWWRKAIAETTVEGRLSIIRHQWQPYLSKLPLLRRFFEQQLKGVELVQYGSNQRSLIYCFRTSSELRLYEAPNPFERVPNEKTTKVLGHLPSLLRGFYEEMHDGWFEMESTALGLWPVRLCFYINEEEWGDIGDFGDKLTVAPCNLLAIFSNAGSGYLCIDTRTSAELDDPHSQIWWSTEPPQEANSFWKMLDAWIEIGLTT